MIKYATNITIFMIIKLRIKQTKEADEESIDDGQRAIQKKKKKQTKKMLVYVLSLINR